MARILSLDQSYTATGLSIHDDGKPVVWDVIKPSDKLSWAARRDIIVRRVREVLPVVDLVVIEELWEAPGISLSTSIIDAAYAQNKTIKALNPMAWKKRMLGDGRAPKSVSIQVAQERTGETIADDNVADSILIGLCAIEYPNLLKPPEKGPKQG